MEEEICTFEIHMNVAGLRVEARVNRLGLHKLRTVLDICQMALEAAQKPAKEPRK